MMRYISSGLRYLVLGALASTLAASPTALAAQERHPVIGRVVEEGSGRPVAGALVETANRAVQALTDAEGRFRLLLTAGGHELTVTMLGYGSRTRTVEVASTGTTTVEVLLESRAIELEGLVVDLDYMNNRVRELAQEREERRKSLENYSATIHRLALVHEHLSETDDAGSGDAEGRAPGDTTRVIAFSERVVRQSYLAPRSYSERVIGRRSSDNFFSEIELFSAGGAPLDLNSEIVDVNILSEVVSVIGPISSRAPDFYEITDAEAGEGWPEGTTRITVRPKIQSRPLFDGHVWIEERTGNVIGIDMGMNEAAEVHNGFASVEGFRYSQSFEQIEEYWLPVRTEVEAEVGMIGFPDVTVRERWVHTDYEVNGESVDRAAMPLSGIVVEPQAGSRSPVFWNEIAVAYIDPEEAEELRQAQEFEEDRALVNAVMAGFRAWASAPAFLENGYLTNISDFYRFNRVEGHYLGVGLRTPAARKGHQYKGSIGVGTESEDLRYYLEGRQFIPGTRFAVEGGVYNKLAIQFGDYRHEVGPTNIDEFRYTLSNGFAGYDPRNYFEREGFEAGLRWQPREGLFLRGGFIREDHEFLPVVTTNSFVGGDFESNRNLDVSPTPDLGTGAGGLAGFTPGELSGFQLQLHHDNRQYRSVGLFKDYNVRSFGWYMDHLVHISDPSLGSDDRATFDFVKYRSAVGLRLPVFSAQYLHLDLTVGASNNPLPAQIQFGHNGVYVEDYLRLRPFLSLGFDEGVGNRVSTARIEYDFGSDFSRLFPWLAFRQSGVQLKLWGAGGVRHHDASLEPALPWTDGVEEHVEVGFALTRLMGIFSIDLALRVKGDEGDRVGLTFIL